MEHSIIKPIKSISGRAFEMPKIQTEPFTPFVNHDMADTEYHSKKEYMSSSACKMILKKSPYYFLQYWCGMIEQEEKDYFNFGRALHMALLMPKEFSERYVIKPNFGRTKVDLALKARFYKEHEDCVILSETEREQITGMIDSVLDHQIASGMLKEGVAEVSIFFKDEDTNVLCRARPDFIRQDKDTKRIDIIDVKTTVDAEKFRFASDISKYQYHSQLAFYRDAVEKAYGVGVDSVSILAIEKKFPYDVFLYTLDEEDLEEGRKFYKQALRTYVMARVKDKWPRAQHLAEMIRMPMWSRGEQLPEFDFGE